MDWKDMLLEKVKRNDRINNTIYQVSILVKSSVNLKATPYKSLFHLRHSYIRIYEILTDKDKRYQKYERYCNTLLGCNSFSNYFVNYF